MTDWPFGVPPGAIALLACSITYRLVRHRRKHPVLVWLVALLFSSLLLSSSPWLTRELALSLANFSVAGATCGVYCGVLALNESKSSANTERVVVADACAG